MADIWHQGRSASSGIAIGPIFRLSLVKREETARLSGATLEPAAQAASLRVAIAAALEELATLIARAEKDGAEVLEFQIAMLEDDALSEPAFMAIEHGDTAEVAWREALSRQVEDYANADDDYFSARVADLKDIRDHVIRHLRGDTLISAPAGAILVGDDITPSVFLGQDWSNGGGIALTRGSPSSHVAMLARLRNVPMVVGASFDPDSIADLTTMIVDAETGRVAISPDAETQQQAVAARQQVAAQANQAEAYRLQPGCTADGTDIKILINIAGIADLKGLDPAICDGIGLVRTEFLFPQNGRLPDEEAQYDIYRQILLWAKDRPVTIRTLDAGGDKPIAGLTLAESNPFLGLRGLRLSLVRPDVFRVQLRALCRAAVHGNLKVMLPMVTVPTELEAARRHLQEVIAELATEGVVHRQPPLGIMVEVPSTALTPERFAAEFYSIGSNDLTQYTLAVARDLDSVSNLSDASDPAVLKLIEATVAHGLSQAIEVSLCGDAAGDVRLIPALLKAGLRSLSMAPSLVGRVKATLAATAVT